MRKYFKIYSALAFAITAFLLIYCSGEEPGAASEMSQSFTSLSDVDSDDGDFFRDAAGNLVTKYKVFSPFGKTADGVNDGVNWGQEKNCYSGLTHNPGINGLGLPMDIGAVSPSTAVNFYCNATIRSIRTIKTGPNDDGDKLCSEAATPPSGFGWVNEGVKVELWDGYNATGTKVGVVFYGHLKNRIANGVYNNADGLQMGNVGDSDCNCNCYNGFHVHTEASSNATRTVWNCSATTNIAGTRVVYKFRSDRPL